MTSPGRPRRRYRMESPRWGVLAAAAVALLALGQVCLAATEVPPRLGLRAAVRDGQVVLSWVQPAGLAWDAGLRPGDVVTAIDGRPAAAPLAAAAATASAVAVRTADGRAATATTGAAEAGTRRRQGPFLILAAWFALVGGVVYVLAQDLATARALLVSSLCAAAALLGAIATPYGATWALALVFVALSGFAAGTFLLFLRFPIDRTRARGGQLATAGCLAANVALLAAYAWSVAGVPAAYRWLQPAWFAVLLGELLGACGLAAGAFGAAGAVRREVRGTLAVIALGLVAGVLPFCLLILLPPLLGLRRAVAPADAVPSLGLLPAGLALAVLSRQFFGITRFVRRGLVAVVVWLGLLGLYALALDGLRQWLDARHAPLAVLLGSTLTTGALFAGTFPPVQGALRSALERRLFPDHYDYAATLRQFGAALVGLPSGEIDVLAEQVLARLAAILDLSWAGLVLDEGSGETRRWAIGTPPDDLPLARFLHAGDGLAEPATIPLGGAVAFVVPLVADGRPRGALALGPKRHDIEILPEDAALVATLAPLIATALQNALHSRQLAAQVTALAEREEMLAALNARLLRAQEEERRRIALEIHDDPLQRVTLLARSLGAGGALPPTARPMLEEIGGALRAICIGLRPPVLDDLGLVAALDWLAEDVQARAEGELAVCVRAEPATVGLRLAPDLEAALFRVAQEALNNVLKHAGATRVEVALQRTGEHLRLRVADDGRGCGAPDPAARGRRTTRLGLAGMRERLRPWGGVVTVAANPSGGTTVETAVPLGRGDA